MSEIKSMTDAELVEAAAREVMGYGNHWYLIKSDPPVMRTQLMGEPSLRWFRPFTDMNDLQMVKDKFFGYKESKSGEWVRVTLYSMDDKKLANVLRPNAVRAWFEAALEAERGKE